ncbi:MAG: peroxiredoxin-like family protein [Proteobacteria bacterium]|nr:peroxiredoxin-like family protein [Pseudomonadota bacterium]
MLKTLVGAMLLATICALGVAQSLAGNAIADSAELVEPLRTGQRAPSFIVPDADGVEFAFNPDALQKPAVIVTFRGGWCPYCNMHLSELSNVMPQINALGIDVIFLSGDRPELLYASLREETQDDIANLDYKIYSDADMQAAIALGIAFKVPEMAINRRIDKGDDIGESSMLQHGALPVPAVFAIDQSGVIQFDFVEADYKVRLPADELLAVAQKLVE